MNRKFGTLIKKVNNSVTRNADKFAQTLGLTSVQISIIDYIAHNEEKDVFQRDIEKEFNIRRATATSSLKLMEDRNLITRTPVKKDARLKQLKLTPKANNLSKQIDDYFNETEKIIIDAIGPENKLTVSNGLSKIINQLSD
ncbi:transcription regulator [Companilactobacillus tucceti DSM 20183]|uniref:Transcription regulator n=1 Tax=Companilactobacillus tucceti DSM 20183 TaxID=1423811 RepID=A0A0R1IYT6_9LACO|nr:MarR family winged helix-turn-helix transcriptional regulator [Companilactobacillus tucceti]KRK64398.1 transcription regulator [Companilactobacillus tucceti DSM 20183]